MSVWRTVPGVCDLQTRWDRHDRTYVIFCSRRRNGGFYPRKTNRTGAQFLSDSCQQVGNSAPGACIPKEARTFIPMEPTFFVGKPSARTLPNEFLWESLRTTEEAVHRVGARICHVRAVSLFPHRWRDISERRLRSVPHRPDGPTVQKAECASLNRSTRIPNRFLPDSQIDSYPIPNERGA